MVALDRIADLTDLKRRLLAKGVWIRPFGRIIYLTPSFTISSDDLARLTAAVVDVVREIAR